MSVQTYVGARYVPKFSGVYDPTQIYQALEVVDNGSGTSYISRKTVPAGTPLTDSDYWFVYGAASGAILQLQTDVGTLQSEMADVYPLKDGASLEMSERSYLFLCDSYQVVADYMQYVRFDLHAKNIYSRARTAAGFISPTVTFMQVLTSLDPLTQTEKDNITHIVICASALNDIYNNAMDLYNAMYALNDWFVANIPNLREVLLLSLGWSNAPGDALAIQRRVLDTSANYSYFAPICQWGFVDCTRVMKTSYIIDPALDGFHPNAEGGLQMSRCIAQSVLTGNCQWQKREIVLAYNITLPSAWSGASILTPSSGAENVLVNVNPSGEIGFHLNDFIMEIDGIPGNNTGFFDIELTPTVNYHNVFPVGYRVPLTVDSASGGSSVWDWALLMRYDNTHTVIRVGTNQTWSGTKKLRIFSGYYNIPYSG